ncbi:LysR family transcriptional regulator [Secundilactobacillus silagincola]|uniref:LysR family transcriptional regulator n=1 Tax=Secundilactobacillus silagincola TaxID=1714681 RepID=A0A1Z5J3J5_9LACO|nr:LysR family transcriptional regulator [Secundilactobacillus silagincola]GAX08643.1 LysR family transcriptional regulator [Secundilactobacillus silagincola]
MNLLGLRYFITVADYASFTKAAEHLFVTQPTLSRQISDLEDEMDTPLFIRSHHSLKLTSAGNRFLKEAIRIVNQLDHLKEVVNPGESSQAGTIRIGYQSFLDTNLMYQILKQVSQKFPQIDLPLFRGTPSELRNQLLNDNCDVVFALSPCIQGLPQIDYIDLQENKLKIAVPLNHRLAHQNSVNLKDLANENFVMLDRKVSPYIVDYAISLCMQNGFSPNASHYVDNAEKALMFTGAGKGITFLHSMNKVSNPIDSFDVKLLNIEGQVNDFDFVLAYKETNHNPQLTTFMSEVSNFITKNQQKA